MGRRIALGLVLVVLVAAIAAVALTTTSARGYFAPIFASDGASVYVLVRDVSASIVGPGYDTLTPPASVWIHRDRFSLVNIRLADGRVTVVREFPATPLEGARISTYHGSIFGESSAHLRWADPEHLDHAMHLDYELTVTRPDSPASRTFVIRRRWNSNSGATEDSESWQEGYASMSGDEPSQLAGDREVIPVRGPEGLPCAVVILQGNDAAASVVADTGRCGDRYANGFTRDSLETRRAAIERVANIQKTYAKLVAEGRAQGLSDGAAMLQANKGMQRLGLSPKAPTITAQSVPCGMPPVFRISDQEFRVGLFQDIQQAIEHPGDDVDFSGDYITHRDFTTSRALNDFLADREHREFTVDGHGGCWRMRIDHRR
jgi:hypothetical protein